MARRRKGRKRRTVTQKALEGKGPKSDFSIAGIVLDRYTASVDENQQSKGLPRPAIPVAVRDEDEELRRATKNQQYYQRRGGQENKPWFHCARHPYKYSEDILITPEMAKALLDYNPMNRNITDGVVDGYRRDINNDRWINSHESIGIDTGGNLMDGQHRLIAIIEANKAQVVYVTFQVPPEARFVVDGGKKRPTSQKLKFIDPSLNTKVPSVAISMMRGTASSAPRYTDSEKAEFVHLHGEVILKVQRSLPPSPRADVVAAICKAVIWHSEELIMPFAAQIKKLKFDDGDPAKALFLYLTKAKTSGKKIKPAEVYKKTLAALQAYIEGRNLTRLYDRDEDFFEWEPGWQVPAHD